MDATEIQVEEMQPNKKAIKPLKVLFTAFVYVICAILTVLSIVPFWVMVTNSTRTTGEIQSNSFALAPGTSLVKNYKALMHIEDDDDALTTDGKKQESKNKSSVQNFDPVLGFRTSMIISVVATLFSVYFSTMTAYAIVVYDWKFKRGFFTFIMAVMMIPTQVTTIGFYHMIFKTPLNGTPWPLILPAIAAPSMVFFMKQYMQPALSLEIIQSARIDGSGEFNTFNRIALPIMKPALATQAIFAFVSNWNNLFLPQILLSSNKNWKTLPMMVALLKGDTYKTNQGALYLAITMSILPLFIVYFLLSKYIIAGVALGSVKG